MKTRVPKTSTLVHPPLEAHGESIPSAPQPALIELARLLGRQAARSWLAEQHLPQHEQE
jgi:hypothetical protein